MKLLRKLHFSVLTGTLIYLLFGVGWIVVGYLISDQLYAQRATSLFELFKGLGFVAITSLLVFVLLGMRRPDTADTEPGADYSTDLNRWLEVRERSQWWLTITVVTVVLVIFLATYFSLEAMRGQTLQHEEEDASTLAYSVAAQIGASLKIVDLILQEAVEHRLQDVDDQDAELRLLQQEADEYISAIWLLDQDGKIIHDSDTGNIGTDLSNRGYFVRHAEGETTGLFIGDPIVSSSTDTPLVCASRGIRREDGEFLGVVCAALDQMQFANFWQLPAEKTMVGISLLNEQNEVLLRNSTSQELTEATLNTLSPANGTPSTHTIEDANGEFSLVGGSNIDAFPGLKVAVQAPLQGLIDEWRTIVTTSMSGLLAVTLVLFGILTLRMRQHRTSAALEQRVIVLAHYPMDNINPVLTISTAGEFKFLNPSAIRLLESLKGTDSQAQLKQDLLQLSRQSSSGTSELNIENMTLLVSTVSIRNGDCNFYLTDVTSTRSDESVLKFFYELPFLGMAITSPETQAWVQVNDQLCAILGYPREELTKLTWSEITHPDDLEADLENFNSILAGNSEGYRMDKRFIRRDGTIIHATIDVRVVRKPSGEIKLIVATVQDITERKQSEDSLRLQKNLYAALSASNHAIARAGNREELFEHICQAAIEHAGFLFAWIGELDGNSGTLKPVSVHGDDDGYVASIRVSTDKQDRHGEGPGGRAVRTKTHIIIADVEHDESIAPWRDDLLARGVKAFASFPIVVTTGVFGTFSVYGPSADYFADNLIALLDEMTLDLGFALDNLALKQAQLSFRKSLEDSEARFRSAIE
jgi:PAS domain S-box-containing protein